MKKRVLSLVLTLCMLVGLLPGAALAAPAAEPMTEAPEGDYAATPLDAAIQLLAVDSATLQPTIALPDADASKWYSGGSKSPMTSADWQTGQGAYDVRAESSGSSTSITLKERARSKTAQYILQPFTLSMEVPAYTTYAVTFAIDVSLSRSSDGSSVMFMTLTNNEADAAYDNSYCTGQEEEKDPTYLFRAHANTRAYTPSAEMTFAFTNTDASRKTVNFPLALVVGANQAGSALASYQHQLEAKLTFTAQSVTARKAIFYTENGVLVARQTFSGDSVKIGVTPTKPDCIFTGWQDNATSTVYQVGDTYTGDQGATMAAQWRSAKIRVTFSANGGSADAATEQTIGKAYALPGSPTRTGHAFDGWYTEADGGSRITTGTIVPDQADHTLYAHWTPRTYTITFNANGGSGDQSVRRQYGQTLGELPAAPARTGYTFKGWFTGKDDGDPITPGTAVPAGNTTYYAHWTGNPVTVTLNPDGGTGAPASLSLTYGGAYSGLTNPTKAGCTFDGWFTQGGAQVANATPITTAADHTLTARWTAKQYTVTFKDGSTTAATRSVAHGQPLGELPAAPAKTGWTFGGWKNGSTAADPNATVTQNATYTAAWTANTYTVTYDYQGGTGTPASKQVTFGGTYGDLPTPTKATYAFLGWSNAAGSPVTAGDTVTTAADHTLTARWGRNPVTVTFDSQGGSTVAGRTVSADDPVGQLPTPTRAGYTFNGWYTAPSGGTKITANTPVPADVTYYAQWAVIQYTVNLDPNGGTVDSTTQTVTYGGNYSLPTPTRTGYTFNGWFTDPTGGDKVENNAAVTPVHRTLYAHWTANQYTVAFKYSSTLVEGRTVTYGQPYGPLPVPDSGYQIYSWYLDTNSNKVYADTIVTTAADHIIESTKGSHGHGGYNYASANSSALSGDGTGTYSMSRDLYISNSATPGTVATTRQIVVDVGETHTVTLCLNGQALTSSFTGGPAILVKSGTLNICDCKGGGKITSTSSNPIVEVQSGGKLNLTANLENPNSYGVGVKNAGTLTVTGGSVKGDNCGIQNLTGGHVTVSGGEVVLIGDTGSCAGIKNEGTLELTGGSVRTNTGIAGYAIDAIRGSVTIGGAAQVTGFAGVNLTGGTFTLNGGVVASTDFFGIDILSGNTATLTVNGGSIQGKGNAVNNLSANGRVEIKGGSVTSTSNIGVNNKGALTVTGGTIQGSAGGIENEGSAALSGGSILGTGSYAYGFRNLDAATLSLSGSPAIHGKAADIRLAAAEKVNLTAPLTGKFSVNTSTTVSETAPFAITGSNSADCSAHFTAADPTYAVRNAANNVVQLCKPHTCAHGVFDAAATSGASLTTGSYYLSASVTGLTVPAGATADLCLNSYSPGTITGSGTLNLYNCAGNGAAAMVGSGLTVHWHSGKLVNAFSGVNLHLHTDSPAFSRGDPAITGGKIIFHTTLNKPSAPWVVRPAAALTAGNPQFVFTSGWSGFMRDASPKEYFTTDRDSITVDMSETGEAAVRLKRVTVDGETVYADYNSGRVTLPAAPAPRTGYIWSGWTPRGMLTSSQYTDGQVFTSTWTPCQHPGKDAPGAAWTTVTQATCTAPGSRTYACSCGVTVTETVEKLAHTYGGWVTTDPDTHYKECSVCHAHDSENVHSWNEGAVTTAPACTTAGVMTYTCAGCNKTREVAIDPLGHDYSVIASDAAGHWKTCSRTGCAAADAKEPHTFGAWSTTAEPQIGVPGQKARSCAVCGYTATQDIPALPAPKYSVTYEGDKYTAGTIPTEDDHEENDRFALSDGNGLSRTGYTLAGWLLPDEDGKVGDAPLTGSFSMPAREVTFQVCWTRIGSYPLRPGETVVLEDGTAVANNSGVITIDQGGDGRPDTTVVLSGTDTVPLRTPNGDGKDYLEIPGGTTVTSAASGTTVTLGGDGTVDILGRVSAPTGSTVLDKDGSKITVTGGDGANVDPDGVVTFPKDTQGKVTVEKDGKETEVTVPGGGEGLDVAPDGKPIVQAPNQAEGGDDKVVIYNPDGTTTTITPPSDPTGDGDPITTDENGSLVVPGGATVTPGDKDGNPTGEPTTVPDGGTVTLHTHVFGDTWVNTDPTHHWHECTAEDCTIKDGNYSGVPGSGYGKHVYTDSADTECNTCGYKRAAQGYTIDYVNEKITIDTGYEVRTRDGGSGDPVTSGSKLNPGDTLYIRQTGDGTDWLEVKIPARPAAPTVQGVNETAAGAGDGKLTGLTAGTAYQIAKDGGDWEDAAVTESGEITGLVPGSYQVRAKATDHSFTGEPTATVTVTIPAAGPAHDWGKWTITKEPTLDAPGQAAHSCPGDENHAAHSETGVKVPPLSDATVWTEDETQRVEPTEDAPGSRTYTSEYGEVTVATPAASHEHKWGDWESNKLYHWRACSLCGEKKDYGGHVYTDDQDAACDQCGYTRVLTQTAPAENEGYNINYTDETITVTDGYEVSTKGDSTGAPVATGAKLDPGATLYIRKRADATHAASDWTPLPVPARPAAPAVQGGNETAAGAGDGKIAGLTAGTAYQIAKDGGDWEEATVTESGEIIGLAPGSYQVRAVATGSSFAGQAASVSVATGNEKTYTLNVTAPTFNAVFEGYEQPDALPIIIQNSGNAAATVYSVAADTDVFTIDGEGDTVPAGGSIDAWTVRPAADLDVGTHTATVTVTYNDDATATAEVIFTVRALAHAWTWEITADPTMDDPGQAVRSCPGDNHHVKHSETGVEIPALSDETVWTENETKRVEPTEDTDGSRTYTSEYGAVTVTIPATGHAPAYSVSGAVTEGGVPLPGARVKLMQGTEQFGETFTTGPDGLYHFADVAPGDYNVVATSGGRTMTILVIVGNTDADGRDLDMPIEKVNSVLVVEPGTPDVVVDGLDGEAKAVKAEEPDASSVTVIMTVTGRTESTADHAADIKNAAQGRELEYLEIKVEKIVEADGQVNADPVTTTSGLMTVIIPFDPAGKFNVEVYRYHGNRVDTLTAEKNRDGEYIRVGDNAITLYVKNFSTYAIGYTETEDLPEPPAPSRPSGSSRPGGYTPNIQQPDHGKITVSPARPTAGDKVTVTVTPDTGYAVDAVTVTDRNGKAVEVTRNADGTYTFTQPTGAVTVSATVKEADCAKDETCPAYHFTDLDLSAWYHDGVHYCVENGLMAGTSAATFEPATSTSRAMIATILWRLQGSKVVNYAMRYDDVAEGTWYTEAVRWATSEGIVTGYGNGHFGPNDPITREQLAVMLYRYEQTYGDGGFTGNWMFLLDFHDRAEVSEWAYEAMCWMTMNGVIAGKSNKVLDPKGQATRAEAAAMLQRFCALS